MLPYKYNLKYKGHFTETAGLSSFFFFFYSWVVSENEEVSAMNKQVFFFNKLG